MQLVGHRWVTTWSLGMGFGCWCWIWSWIRSNSPYPCAAACVSVNVGSGSGFAPTMDLSSWHRTLDCVSLLAKVIEGVLDSETADLATLQITPAPLIAVLEIILLALTVYPQMLLQSERLLFYRIWRADKLMHMQNDLNSIRNMTSDEVGRNARTWPQTKIQSALLGIFASRR